MDPMSPLGNNGVFGSVISNRITVTVEDPCIDTVILNINDFPSSLTVPAGQSN